MNISSTPTIFLVALILAMGGCTSTDDSNDVADTATPYRNLDPEVRYVGQDVCAECHVDKFDTYTESQMGRSFKPAHLDQSAAIWEDVDPVYDQQRDLYYQAFHRDEELFVMEYRIASGDTVHKRIEKIDYIVGSGQHTNSHMMDVNGYLYQIPLTWYAQDGRWDLAPGFENNNSRFSRPITQACMGCHNAVSGFVEGSENKFTELPHGIDCERCHGPGELHVAEKKEGDIVDVRQEIDYSIVNPAKLPIERQFDVCQRCHMQGATVYEEGKTPYDFKPGMNLASVMNVYAPRHSDSTSRFIMASHPDRLQMSECFIGSREALESRTEAMGSDGSTADVQVPNGRASHMNPMTCITCHDPHLPIETLGRDHYRSACNSCHTSGLLDEASSQGSTSNAVQSRSESDSTLAGLCTAPSALRIEQNDDCVACHMPQSESTDIPHVSVTDHNIRVVRNVSNGERITDEEFVGLASLIQHNVSHGDVAAGYMTYFEEVSDVPYFLDSAAVHLERAEAEESVDAIASSLVRLRFLQNDPEAIVRLLREIDPSVFQDGWSYYRIGEAYVSVGDAATAAEYFRRAVETEPDHLRFRNRLGMIYTSLGRYSDALRAFDAVLSANPKYSDAYNNRGFARAMQGDLSNAEEDFIIAIQLDPDAYQAMANLASLYVNTGQDAKARPYAQRLLEHDPENEAYRRLLEMTE